jgi:hypothetical protein
MKVDLKKRKRLSAKKEVAKSVDVCESHPSIYLNTCDVGSGDPIQNTLIMMLGMIP